MNRYEKPIIEEEIIQVDDIICLSGGGEGTINDVSAGVSGGTIKN